MGLDGLNGYIWVGDRGEKLDVEQLPRSGNATLTAATVPTCSPQLQTVIIIINNIIITTIVIIIIIIIVIITMIVIINIMIIISIIQHNTLN